MKGRILVLWAACALVVLVVALAQSDVNPAENPAASDESKPAQSDVNPAGNPAASDESKPASVATPTSDAEANEAGQPLVPQALGESPETGAGTTRQPEPIAPAQAPVAPAEGPIAPAGETAVADQAMIPPEPARKLWRITPILSAGVVYDDNIFLENTNRVADVIWTISFGLAFELGDFRGGSENYVTAQWVGMPSFYTDNPNENAFNQAGFLLAQYRWTKLVAQVRSGFGISRQGNREVNTITTTQTFYNALRFQYDYSDKTSFDLQFRQASSRDSDASTSSGPIADSGETTNNEYETKAGMNYQIFPKTNMGLEVVGGISDQASSPLQYYQQARVRLLYVATGKLNVKFSGGVEAREFQGIDQIKISPIFSLGIDYRPFDGTTISVVGYRTVSPATSITGQDVTATGFNISATQRILQKFIAGTSFGYENDVYSANSGVTTTQTNRVDNYLYMRLRLSYSFVRWCSANVFYEHRRTNSSQTISSFYDNRIGMEIAAEF
jgi:Putative beta-barrel porin 2